MRNRRAIDKKRGVAIELAVLAMAVATALGGLIVTSLLYGSNKTEKLLALSKERAEIDYVADTYINDLNGATSAEYGEYEVEKTSSGFLVKKNGETKLTVEIEDGIIKKWKY